MKPTVGCWYKNIGDEAFEVVAVDEDAVELVYEDGSVEDMDLEDWNEECGMANITPCERPWSDGFAS